MSYAPLTPPDVGFDAEGHFRNILYGDVYHSTAGALGQTEAVFLRGNGLPQRWRGRPSFTVCETGFGLGMNFLALWRAWREDPARSRRLHMVSVEAHPFDREELARILARIAPEPLRRLADQLVEGWPVCLPGLHRLEFEHGAVTLTLGFGRAETVVPRLRARVDAFFLDGFAPKRNPDLWQPSLMRELARLAAPDATLATWASAGAVRRALTEAGFEVTRQPGYAGKLHMTVGVRAATVHSGSSPAGAAGSSAGLHEHAWNVARAADETNKSAEIVVIGAGLAGGGLAQALALRGRSVVVIDTDANACAMAQAGHLAAALTPVVARDDNPRARLSRAGSARAWARWAGLPEDASPRRCGTVQVERDEGRSAALHDTLAQLQFPRQWARAVDREEAAELAGLPVARGGLFFQDGMLVQPAKLIPALLGTPGVRQLVGHVWDLRFTEAGWLVRDTAGAVLAQAPTVIVANAYGARALLQNSGLLDPLPRLAQMHRLAGQVSILPAAELAGGPRCIVGGEGYLLPAVRGQCVAGSTYEHAASVSEISAQGQATVLAKVQGLLARDLPASLRPGELAGWAGWRAVLPGRLPAIGPLSHAPGVWMATGYASRGLSWSALAGDVMAAALCEEPVPLESDLLAAIAPR